MELQIAAFSAFFSALASLAALWQVRKAGTATEASILLAMSERYAQPDMREAIKCLAQFGREAKGKDREVADHYRQVMDEETARSEDIREKSRVLSSYFCDAHRLAKAGFISRNTLKYVVSHPGINVFYEVAVPMNEVRNPSHNSIAAARSLHTLVAKHGIGLY